MTASRPGPFRLHAEMLGALPVVDHFLDRLSMAKLLEEHLPGADGRVRLAPAKAIGVVVRNLALSHQPLYSMNDWATGHDPAFLGLEPDEVSLINDDRIGDDETLWCGGYILTHPEFLWRIVTLCRAADPDRAPRFGRVLRRLGAEGEMADLDDGPDQTPLPVEQVQETTARLLAGTQIGRAHV